MEWSWFGPATSGLDRKRFSARVSATLCPLEDGVHTLSVASAGLARILVDGVLVVDNWTRWERGDLFYGMGSTEVTGTVALRAGQHALVEVEYSKKGSPVAGGIRVGILPPMPDDAMERAVEAARESDVAVVVVGLDADWETEGSDRVNLDLPGRQAELVTRVAAANPRTVVVLNAGGPIDVESFVDVVPALLQAGYLGQEAGHALADVIFGDASPSGRLPTTWPRRLADVPGQLGYPGEFGSVTYAESVFMGYRWYDAREIAPRFAFGHGLTYTCFAYETLELERSAIEHGEGLQATVDVTNTGTRSAAEIVQVYLRDVASSALRPRKELVAFARVELAPGERRRVEFEIPAAAFAFRDPLQHAFIVESGEFEVLVGASSSDIRLRARVDLVGDTA
jgi:beta-glucosidase